MKTIYERGRRGWLSGLLIGLGLACWTMHSASAATTTNYSYLYDANHYLTGQRVEVSDGVNILSATESSTDALGREVKNIAGTGATEITTEYSYDVAGNMTRRTIENGDSDVLTQYTYDVLGRQVTVQGPSTELGGDDCPEVHYVYDSGGNAVTQSTKVGHSAGSEPSEYAAVYSEYDALNRVIHTIEDQGGHRRTFYNSRSLPIREYAYKANGSTPLQQIRTEYDAAGRVISRAVMLDPANSGDVDVTRDQVVVYGYDNDGRVTQQTVYGMRSSTARNTVKEYDGLGRLTKTTDPKGVEESLQYDGSGLVTRRIVDDDVAPRTTDMAYDSDGRMTMSIAVGPPALTTWYAYDGLGRRTEVTDPEDRVTVHVYDTLGREVTKIEDSGGLNRTTEYKYSKRGVLTAIVANDGNDDQETLYGYAPCGQVASITYPDNGVMSYSYYPSGSVKERIDPAGNTLKYFYDKRGLLLTKGSPSGDYWLTYAYDDLGRMVTACAWTDENQTTTKSMTIRQYNGLSQLIGESQSVLGGTPRNLAMEYDQAGNRLRLYYPD